MQRIVERIRKRPQYRAICELPARYLRESSPYNSSFGDTPRKVIKAGCVQTACLCRDSSNKTLPEVSTFSCLLCASYNSMRSDRLDFLRRGERALSALPCLEVTSNAIKSCAR